MDQKIKDNGIRFIAVMGIAALLGFGTFVILRTYEFFPPIANRLLNAATSLTTIFRPSERLILESSKVNLSSGDTFTLSWTHTGGRGQQTPALFYPCLDAVSLSVVGNGSAGIIPCNSSYPILTTTNNLDLTVLSTTSRFVDLPVSLSIINQNEEKPQISESLLLLINNANLKAGTETDALLPATENTTSSSTAIKKPVPPKTDTTPKTSAAGPKKETLYPVGTSGTSTSTKPDLIVRILEIGVVDKTSNVFIATTTLKNSDRIAVRFEVENLGREASGEWRFNAVLPTYPFYIFQSEAQQSLSPRDRIEYTLGFDNIEKSDGNLLTINADPASSINESNEENNIARTTIGGVKF